jgi:hypothetical protein
MMCQLTPKRLQEEEFITHLADELSAADWGGSHRSRGGSPRRLFLFGSAPQFLCRHRQSSLYQSRPRDHVIRGRLGRRAQRHGAPPTSTTSPTDQAVYDLTWNWSLDWRLALAIDTRTPRDVDARRGALDNNRMRRTPRSRQTGVRCPNVVVNKISLDDFASSTYAGQS